MAEDAGRGMRSGGYFLEISAANSAGVDAKQQVRRGRSRGLERFRGGRHSLRGKPRPAWSQESTVMRSSIAICPAIPIKVLVNQLIDREPVLMLVNRFICASRPAGIPGTDFEHRDAFDSELIWCLSRKSAQFLPKLLRCTASAVCFRLLRASTATRRHSHGRRATNAANLAVRNWPWASMKRDISGISKSNSSEMTFMVPRSNSVGAGGGGNGGGFHVDSLRAVSLREAGFLLRLRRPP